MSASFSTSQGPGILNFNPNTLDFVRSVKVGECFFEVAEVSGLNSTTKMGGMDGFLSQRFQGKQPTYIHISDRNIGFAFLVVALLKNLF